MPEGQQTVSACIIARDEEERLPQCLDALRWCDEVVVVVDSRSTDNTAQIARDQGCRVIVSEWLGFARQRNLALDSARGDWALEVDADERITPALAQEIRSFLAAGPDVDIAAFPIREIFLGARLRSAGKYPNYRHRLFRRTAYRHDPHRIVHEGLWPRGEVHVFRAEMDHVRARTLSEGIGDAVHYSRLVAAQSSRPSGVAAAVSGLLLRPVAKFAYRTVVYRGWRDGWRGLTLMALDSVSDVLVSAMLLARRAPASAAGGHTHFGHASRPSGGVVVGLAAGRAHADSMLARLREESSRGADVVLVTDAPPVHADGIAVRSLRSFSPFSAIRALEEQDQLRPISRTLTAGRMAHLAVRIAPRHLRGEPQSELGR